MMDSCTKLILVLIGTVSVLQVAWSSTTVHDIDQDRAECTDQVIGMATCLPYVGGEAKVPTMNCCSGLKQVLSKSLKCVCVLVKDRDDPSLGLKINTTLALGLPGECHSPVNISQCIDILKLPASSPDAQMFAGFEKSLESKNSTSTTNAAPITSNGNGNSSSGSVKNLGTIRLPWLALTTIVAFGVVITWDDYLLNAFLRP